MRISEQGANDLAPILFERIAQWSRSGAMIPIRSVRSVALLAVQIRVNLASYFPAQK
jgi:hypothetical protein